MWFTHDVSPIDDEPSFVLVANRNGYRTPQCFVPCFCLAECGPSVRLSPSEANDGENECYLCGSIDILDQAHLTKSKESLLKGIAEALFTADGERARQVHKEAEGNERPCPLAVHNCPECTASALDAGIPLSVIQRKTKLTDYFSEHTIALMCGDTERARELEREGK
jgi:hypothetical protein